MQVKKSKKKKSKVGVVCSRRIDRLVLYYMDAIVAVTFDIKDGEQMKILRKENICLLIIFSLASKIFRVFINP